MPYGLSPRLQSAASGNRFLTALQPADHAMLAPHLRPFELTRGAILYDAGEPIEHVHFPHSGMVSLVTVTRDGQMVETATVGRAGIVWGGSGLGSHHAVGRAIVQLPGAASRISFRQFQVAIQSSQALRELVVRYNDLVLAQVQQAVACNALHALEERLCRWLLQAHDCVDSDTVLLTQDFLGQMLGVRRTSVTVMARLLQSRDMIRYQRGRIQIVNRQALEEGACECYGVIKELIDKVFPPLSMGHLGSF